MFVKNFQQLKNSQLSTVVFLFLISFFIRIPIIIIFGDEGLDYEWKNLVYNLVHNGKLVWQTFENGFLLPNSWMPPLYAYYLYSLTFLGLENENYIYLALYSQALLAALSIVLFSLLGFFFFKSAKMRTWDFQNLQYH